MPVRWALIVGLLFLSTVASPGSVTAAEPECRRWLTLVDREVGERKEALGKKAGADRARVQASLERTAGRVTEARSACQAGKDKAATLAALELWDGFVEEERREGGLSLNSRLTILALRADRLKAFHRRGWKPAMSPEEERRLLGEIDRLDGVLAEALKRALQ
ncbi:MAG: hypothetical protein ACREMB_08695 [Candidatus Rokuibacteriota bacterium]